MIHSFISFICNRQLVFHTHISYTFLCNLIFNSLFGATVFRAAIGIRAVALVSPFRRQGEAKSAPDESPTCQKQWLMWLLPGLGATKTFNVSCAFEGK